MTHFDPLFYIVKLFFFATCKKTRHITTHCCLTHLLSIQKEHAVVVNENGKVFLEKASSDAKLLVNGDTVIGKIELDHNDR